MPARTLLLRTPSCLLAALASIFLGACAVGPNYQTPPGNAPQRYSALDPHLDAGDVAVEAPVLDRWWMELGDPVLAALVEESLHVNLDLRSADARIRESRANRNSVADGFEPQLGVSGKTSRDRISTKGESFANIPPTVVPRTTFTDYRVGFDASWELDVFGRGQRAVESAEARLGSAAEQRHDVALAVAAEVARNVVEYRVAVRRVALAQATVEAVARTANLVQLQYRAGIATQLDVQRAESERLSSRAAVPPLDADAQAALLRLLVLLAQAPEQRVALEQRLAASSPPDTAPDTLGRVPVGLPSELARRRPDVRRAERELGAASADIGVATADLYPRFSLIGNLGLDSVQAGSVVSSASRFWSIGPQISWPLFDGGRRRADVGAREAARDAALSEYQKSVLQALSDVETAILRFARSRARADDLAGAALASQANLGLAQQRYRVGDTGLTEVLDVERQYDQARDQSLAAHGQALLDRIALHKALGGGWQAAQSDAESAPPAIEGP